MKTLRSLSPPLPFDEPLPSQGAMGLQLQTQALTTPVREAVITVAYVNGALGIADAHEIETGEFVSLNRNTAGVDLNLLEIGSQFNASITRFHHAVKVVVTSQ